MKISQLLLFSVFLGACQEFKPYESGGFGSINGGAIDNTGSTVTISGRVMSSATYQSYSSSLLGMRVDAIRAIQGLSNGRDARVSRGRVRLAVVTNDCADSVWSMRYVGGGTRVVTSGTSDSDGAFEVPSVPEGKEGLINFNCSSGVQKCLVKAGDTGLACNAIADGVVGALEASFGTALTSTTFSGKTIAKVASSIVEATNSDSADAESLKSAIEACKTIPAGATRNTCYKNSLDSSDQAGVLEVAKTLAQSWSARGILNFVIGTAGYKLYLDSMLYTEFGQAFDDWLDTDFVAQTRAYVADLVNNPVYVGGSAANGEHMVKIQCESWYNKYRSSGQSTFAPAIVAGVPTCYNWAEISKLTGINSESHPSILALKAAIDADEHSNDSFQVGTPGDTDGSGAIDNGETLHDFNHDNDNNPATGVETNCPSGGGNGWDTPGSFCVGVPSLVVVSKNTEPNRNDAGGTNYSEETTHASLIETFPAVMTTVQQLIAGSTGPLAGCMAMPGDGYPMIDFDNPACVSYARNGFRAIRSEFSGMLGLYMYLRNPNSYGSGSAVKLSLNDIHRIMTHRNFFNARFTTDGGGGYGGKDVVDGADSWWTPALLKPVGGNLRNLAAFAQGAPNLNQSEFSDALDDTTLLGEGEFDLLFGDYLTTETSSQLQARVQSASHHEPWNPYGTKYSHLPAKEINVSGTPTLFPIYCRMRNRSKLDSNSNPLPLVGQLGPNSLIDCLADPVAAGVGSTSEGVYTYPTTFAYPYVLQFRGDSGDTKGKLFALADRKTGQTMMLGGSEVLVLEAKDDNSSIVVSGAACGTAFPEPSLSSPAPVVEAKVVYGGGDMASEEIMRAYCLNMSNVLTSDTSTRLYMGSFMELSNPDGSFYQIATVGGRLPNSNAISDICLFASATAITQTGGSTMFNGGAIGYSSYTSGPNSFHYAYDLQNEIIDFCSETHSGKTKYRLTHFYDNNSFVATDAGNTAATNERGDMPVGLMRDSDGAYMHGVLVSVRAIENEMPGLKVANSTAVTYTESVRLLNTKHDPKFDPFCDDRGTTARPDLANNGKCDCFEGTTTTVKAGTCNLGDTPIEPTISNQIYPWGQGEANYRDFFDDYGGLSGAALVDGATPLSFDWLSNENLYVDPDAILSCLYKKSGENFYRRPTNPWGAEFNNEHFEGCPDASGNIVAPTNWSGQNPTNNGGPIRIVKPVEMNNAYDIGRPKQYAALMNYATKSVGQGKTIAQTDKVFSYDEALALMAARMMMPDKSNMLDDAGNPISGRARLRGVRLSDDQDVSIIGAILKGITKPTELAADE